MKISEYVVILQNLQDEVGGIEVYASDFQTLVAGAVRPANPPKVVELATMGPRDKYTRVYYEGGSHKPSGIKVLRLA